MNREEWLTSAIVHIRPIFKDSGLEIPESVSVSVGFPSKKATSAKKMSIGQCWPTSSSPEKVSHIFISPVLDDGVEALSVLVHELIHAIDDCKSKHGGPFVRMARAVGLEGKPSATHAGEDLTRKLKIIVDVIGEYPHKGLTLTPSSSSSKGRLVKVFCEECGYTVRTTRKWIEVALPICGSCNKEMVEEGLSSKDVNEALERIRNNDKVQV